MSSADLAAVAAITAAVLSFIGIVFNVRAVNRGQRDQWRREEERPIVARCLRLSDDAESEWWDASVAKGRADVDSPPTWVDQHYRKGRDLVHDLEFEVAQLDLLASRAVREIARDLAEAHGRERSRLLVGVKPGHDDYEGRIATQAKLKALAAALIEKTRVDLGLRAAGTLPPQKPRSLIGKLLARAENGSLIGRLFGLTRARE